MVNYPYKNQGLTLLRVILGLFFIIAGLIKLFNPQMIIGMLGNLGFSAPVFLGWLVLLTEIIFGILVLIGWRTELTVWPLVIVLVVALIIVYLPQFKTNPMVIIYMLFHIETIVALVTLAMTGPGKLAVTR